MSTGIILDLTTTEIVNTYNAMSKTQVTKFKDRKTAENRLHGLAFVDASKFIKAMKTAKVRPEMIKKYEQEIAYENEKAEAARKEEEERSKKKESQAVAADKAKKADKPKKVAPASPMSSDPDFAAAAQLLMNSQSELKNKEIQEAGTTIDGRKKLRPNSSIPGNALSALWFIRSICDAQKKAKEDEITTSTEIARRMVTSIKAVIPLLDYLKEKKFIEVEDDTTDANDPFYYITITDEGRKVPMLEEEPTIIRDKETKPKKERLPGAAPGPRSDKAGKKIYRLVKENPRREGSIGWTSFNLIRDGMTYEEYISAGGRAGDVQWDLDHGFIELK